MRALKKYWITLGIGLLLVLGIVWAGGVFQQTHPVWVLHILCDAFFVVGAVFFAAGLLVFTSNEGVYDMFVYGTQSLLGAFRKNGRKKYDSFYDYRESRAKKKIPCGFLMICGLLLIAVAAVMYFLYSQYV